KLCSVNDLVKDVDLDDSLSLSTINDTAIVADQWTEIKDATDNSLGEFYYDSETQNIYYRASGDYLAKLRYNVPKELQFSFVVKDNSNETTDAKDFTITVIGTNKPPVAKEIEPYILTPTSQPLVINIDDIAKDTNEDDELNIYSIGDWILNDTENEESFEIKGAIKIQVNKQNKTMRITILNEEIWSIIESLDLAIVVADNSNAINHRSENIIIKIKLLKDSSDSA
ncbi:MAG: hypothetical protein LBC02_08130, partial [Planctomycetaceae bacterium]|nr:hypothetical protein [Planctomycetaceae bacterium]